MLFGLACQNVFGTDCSNTMSFIFNFIFMFCICLMPGPIKSKTIELEFAESEIRSRKFS